MSDLHPSDSLLDALAKLHPKRIDLSLARMHRLLGALGHPEQNTPPVIHIAGTNGKGSTLAFLRAMLTANDDKVHAYTSPHLVRFCERIVLRGCPIGETQLSDCLRRCQAANDGAPITFFEITTAAAFLAFAETAADYLLLEVGLGGRLDATNVVRPRATAITPISRDHSEFLGDTIAAIAAEKAGIIKPDTPVACAPQTPEAARVIETHGKAAKAPLYMGGQDWTSFSENGRLVFQDANGLLDLPLPALAGNHQIVNAGTAVALARLLGVAEKPIGEGLRKTVWAARLQKLTEGRWASLCPQAEIWLDGGHNEAAAAALADWCETQNDARPLHIVLGMMASKTHARFLNSFVALAPRPRLHCVPIDGQKNAIAPEKLVAIAKKLNFKAQAHENLHQALAAVGDGPARVLIVGSLYLAGQVLAEN